MTYDDLLPCPFCGSTNLRYEFAGSQGYICCDNCGTQGPCDEQAADPICDHDAAYAAWNRRPAALADGPAVPEGREPAAVMGQPSNRELLELMPQQFRDDLATVSRRASYGTPVEPGIYRVSLNTGALDFARAVLARWGRPAIERTRPQPEWSKLEPRGCPTPGACSCPTVPTVPPDLIRALEIAEAGLADIGDSDREPGDDLVWAESRAASCLPRIRAVLARWGRPSIEPAPVSERLPGPEDCLGRPWEGTDAGFCWWFYPSLDGWRLMVATRWEDGAYQNWIPPGATHWLPHHVLPVPTTHR